MKNFNMVIYGSFRAQIEINASCIEEAKEKALTKLLDGEISRIFYVHDLIKCEENGN